MTASRSPLGAGIVTLIVVDAVLVLTFFALLLQAVRADVVGFPGGGAPGSSSSTTPAEPAPQGDGSQPVSFALPSGNIACSIDADATTCTIAQFSYAAPELEGCAGSAGNEIRLTPDGAAWVCREGPAPEPAGADVPVLAYGDTTSLAGYTCASAETGVTCRHEETGRSFSLSRGVATLN